MKDLKEDIKAVIKSSELSKKAEIMLTKNMFEILLNRLTIRILKRLKDE